MRAGQTAGLARGPEVRSRRASVRRAIAAGDIDVPTLLEGAGSEQIEEVALEMTVESLLRSMPAVDGAGAALVCAETGVALEARLCTLTIARRRALAAALNAPRKETP